MLHPFNHIFFQHLGYLYKTFVLRHVKYCLLPTCYVDSYLNVNIFAECNVLKLLIFILDISKFACIIAHSFMQIKT